MSESVLGKAQERIDGRLKVTGKAVYSADPAIENLAYGYLVRSTMARAEIRSMDVAAAAGSPGVLAVFTPFSPLKLYEPIDRPEGGNPGELVPPLQSKEVLYYGQAIGLVVAESFEEARDAAGLIGVEYEKQLSVLGLEANLDKAFAPDRSGCARLEPPRQDRPGARSNVYLGGTSPSPDSDGCSRSGPGRNAAGGQT